MDMSELLADKKKLAMLAGLGFALIVVVVLRFGLLENLTLTSASASEGSRAVSLLDADPEHLATVASIARARAQREYTGEEYRDPMEPLVSRASHRSTPSETEQPEREDTVAETGPPRMTLYGIIWDPETPIAMIDGMDLRVGDRIKGARITRIEIDRVVLSYRSREYTLTVD